MLAYNGGTISNLLINLAKSKKEIYVTDTAEHATLYANASATGSVSKSEQEQAENTVVLEIQCSPNFLRRPASHHTLDTCEAVVNNYSIVKANIRFNEFENTMYGNRHTGYKNKEQVVCFLVSLGIEVNLI